MEFSANAVSVVKFNKPKRVNTMTTTRTASSRKYNRKANATKKHLITIVKDGKTVFTSDPTDQSNAFDLINDIQSWAQPGSKVLSAKITVGADPATLPDASGSDDQQYDMDDLLNCLGCGGEGEEAA